MKDNLLRQSLRDGKTVIGTMVQDLKSTAVPIVLAEAGYDFLFICMEHSVFNLETVADLLMATRLSGMTPLVRVSEIQYSLITRCLDAGAQGLMAPRVETREQVEMLVRYSKYPPIGVRGCSVKRAHNDYRAGNAMEFMKKANKENLVFLQIEREKSIEDIDSLLSVKGVDAAILGPNDLAASYGIPNDMDNPIMVEAIQKVVDAGNRHGVYTGIHIRDIQKLKEWMERGMKIIAYQTDLGFLRDAAAKGLKELREWAARHDKPTI